MNCCARFIWRPAQFCTVRTRPGICGIIPKPEDRYYSNQQTLMSTPTEHMLLRHGHAMANPSRAGRRRLPIHASTEINRPPTRRFIAVWLPIEIRVDFSGSEKQNKPTSMSDFSPLRSSSPLLFRRSESGHTSEGTMKNAKHFSH
uniref:Secreted protein n=1 Tax=Steinernema glaseri TaxID=37863 RepID=A0A1I7YNF6_9BILA